MAPKKTNWAEAIKPLIKKYKGKPHPLDYKNIYQLLVMVVLSARSSDNFINKIAPDFFSKYPDMKALAKAKPESLYPLLKGVISFNHKAKWLVTIAQAVKSDSNIPLTMEALVKLQGIGRKSANVIMREAKVKAEGVMVDLHVVRVANRLGIADSEDPKKIEQQIMEVIPEKNWGEAGMALSFLGRDTCRPSHPESPECVMRDHCDFYQNGGYDNLIKENLIKKKKTTGGT